MPRKVNQVPCGFCRKPIDSRGWKVHTLTCKDRPDEAESNLGRFEGEVRQENVRVLLDYYREGLRDGFQFAGKKAA